MSTQIKSIKDKEFEYQQKPIGRDEIIGLALTTVDFGESITFGEALTRVMDAREDKDSKLISW